MKLSVMERIHLMQVLPKEGNFLTLKAIRKARETVSLTEKEVKAWNVRTEGTNIMWNDEKAEEVEIDFSATILEVVEEALKNLDKEKALTEQFFSLYEKFVEKES